VQAIEQPAGGKFTAGVLDTGGNLPPMSLIPVVHLELPISPRIFDKIRKVNVMFFLGAWVKMIHEKT
jgi:hypothetical protein